MPKIQAFPWVYYSLHRVLVILGATVGPNAGRHNAMPERILVDIICISQPDWVPRSVRQFFFQSGKYSTRQERSGIALECLNVMQENEWVYNTRPRKVVRLRKAITEDMDESEVNGPEFEDGGWWLALPVLANEPFIPGWQPVWDSRINRDAIE